MGTRVDITLQGLHQLQERIDRRQLEEKDWVVVGALVSGRIARTEAQQARLRAKAAREAGKQTEGAANDVDRSPDAEDVEDTTDTSEPSEPASQGAGSDDGPEGATGHDAPDSPAQDPPKKGHGRNGADAFVNASNYFYPLTAGIIGALCALCRTGPVFRYRDKVVIRVVGQPLFAAERHHFEQGRCRLCGAVFTADGKELVVSSGIGTGYITYDWSACAMLSFMHYFGGGPFKRLEAMHEGWGIPMSDANQWRIVDECDDLLAPVYRALERHAIQKATGLRFGDTGSMIIDTRRQIQQELQALTLLGESTQHVRTGINATGFYIDTAEGKVVLFFTGRHHAGEIVDQLLARRGAGAKKLPTVTDAASKNFDHDHAEKLEQAVCNAHCFLKFRAVKDQFPAEYAVAAEVYGKVFENDDEAKALDLASDERMLYHREHSKPEMLKLWQMCKDKVDANLIEPSSPLWEPVSFVINQWPRLTKFYEVPGVPLDSNLVEQTLIIPVRYLAGSFAYKTQNGADVGDHFMSLIATANANGVEPVAYLTECLRNHEDLAKRPEHYLPWVYRDRLEQLDQGPGPSSHAQAPPPSGSNPSPRPAQQIHHALRPGTRRAHPATRTSSSHQAAQHSP